VSNGYVLIVIEVTNTNFHLNQVGSRTSSTAIHSIFMSICSTFPWNESRLLYVRRSDGFDGLCGFPLQMLEVGSAESTVGKLISVIEDVVDAKSFTSNINNFLPYQRATLKQILINYC
jgi:hypothetical protein